MIPTVTTRGQARVQKRSAGARETKLPVPIAEKRNRQSKAKNNAIATMSNTYHDDMPMQQHQQKAPDASFDKTNAHEQADWAEQVEKEQQQQEPGNAFDWARSLQQQISALSWQYSEQSVQLAQHQEILTQLQTLMEKNSQLESDLEAQRNENILLRKELDALRKVPQQQHQHHQQRDYDLDMAVDGEIDTQDEIGKACDTVALAMSKLSQAGSSTKDSIHATPSTTTAKPKVSYATVAKKNVGRAQKRRRNNVNNPTEGMVSWATRLFANTSDDATTTSSKKGYAIIYLKSTHRSQHSETRKALAILGVPQGRIIDVHFPVRGVIGLLVHKAFEQQLKDILQKAKISIDTEFSPQSAESLLESQYKDLSLEKRKEKAEELFTERMLRTCARMPKTYLGAAIIRHFVQDVESQDPHVLPPSALTRFNAMCPRKERPTPSHVPTIEEARKILGLPEIEDDESNDVSMDQ